MKSKIRIGIATILVLAACLSLGGMAFAQGQPPSLPNRFYGIVSVDGVLAIDGTTVYAKIGTEVKASAATFSHGQYVLDVSDGTGAIKFYVEDVDTGQTEAFQAGALTEVNLTVKDPKEPNTVLEVYSPDPTDDNTPAYNGTASDEGTNILSTIFSVEYRVDGGSWIAAAAADGAFDSPTEDFSFTTGVLAAGEHKIEVRAATGPDNIETTYASDILTIAAPPGGGGGGGIGAGDTTPPRISNVLLCPEGVTETTADICWETNEKSTSQVKYWITSSMLSPLDKTRVIYHCVHLIDLTPGTAYYYKAMSSDRAGNLEVSAVYTFTTLGKPLAAAFVTSELSISPTECYCGEMVTICVLLTNTGNLAGSYEATLKIDDVVVTSKEVTLAAGAGEQVTFTTAKNVAGSYSVAVNSLTDSFVVLAPVVPPEEAPPEETPPPAKPINWPVIGGIIAAVVAVGVVIFFLVRRKAA